MYTKRIFSVEALLLWTRHDLVLLVALATAPVVVYDTLDQRWLHIPWLPIALVGTAVAFILGFQNNAAYGRAWEARKIWGGIVNDSRAWGLVVKDFVTNQFAQEPASEEELSGIRRRMILRHIGWLTALRHGLRGPRPWERNHAQKTDREWRHRIQVREHTMTLEEDIDGYLPPDERTPVCGRTTPPIHVLAHQSRELRELRQRGLIDDFRHMEMQGVLHRLVDGQGKSERIKNFPYPRQYATLNAVLLWIFLVLIPHGLVYEFADIGEGLDERFDWIRDWFVWGSVPFSTIVMWVFHTVERIGRVTENPFEGSVNDVPITTMARGIEIDLREMIGDDPADIPRPIEPRHHTQT